MEKTKKAGSFSTRWGLIITMIGACVGTGNVWRFPRMAALHGQGSFVLAWTIILFVVSIPICMVEMVMGRATRHGGPGAFRDFLGKKYTWMGAFMALTTMMITGYYTVIMSWCIQYAALSLKGFQSYDIVGLDNLFQQVSNGWLNAGLSVVLLLLTALVVSKDISKGIEKVGKVMTPALYVILIVLAIRVLFLPGAVDGLNYLFDISADSFFSSDTWLAALSQSAWSTGPGFGYTLTMAVYTKAKSDVTLNQSMQGLGDNSAALLAGFLVLPALFALAPNTEAAVGIAASGNYGLTFISLTQMFGTLAGGNIMSCFFFISLFFAAFTANIIFYLTGVVPLIDAGMSKKQAVRVLLVPLAVLCIANGYSLDFLSNQDWVWGMALIIGSLFTCFAVWRFGAEKMRTKYINIPENELNVGKWWDVCIKFIAPIMMGAMLIWETVNSIVYEEQWWNPLLPTSTGTFLAQVALLAIIVICFNKKLASTIKHRYIDAGDPYPEIPPEHQG